MPRACGELEVPNELENTLNFCCLAYIIQNDLQISNLAEALQTSKYQPIEVCWRQKGGSVVITAVPPPLASP